MRFTSGCSHNRKHPIDQAAWQPLISLPLAADNLADLKLGSLDVFDQIYNENVWGDGKGSGIGSDPDAVRPYTAFLQQFLEDNHIKSIVDLGCGDWQFSKELNLKGIHYHGIDVAKSVIESNQKTYSSPTVKFSVLGSYEELPQADLLICKDMLMHLDRKEVQAIIRDAFPKFTNVLITSDVHPYSKVGEFFLKARGKWEGMFNEDILTGEMTPFDIRMSPYNLPGKTVFSWTVPFPNLFKQTSVALASAKGNVQSESGIRRTLRYPLRFLQAIALRDCIWRKETVLVQPQQP